MIWFCTSPLEKIKSLKWSEQKLTSRFIVVELNFRSILENQLSYQKRSNQKLNSRVNFRLFKRFRGFMELIPAERYSRFVSKSICFQLESKRNSFFFVDWSNSQLSLWFFDEWIKSPLCLTKRWLVNTKWRRVYMETNWWVG